MQHHSPMIMEFIPRSPDPMSAYCCTAVAQIATMDVSKPMSAYCCIAVAQIATGDVSKIMMQTYADIFNARWTSCRSPHPETLCELRLSESCFFEGSTVIQLCATFEKRFQHVHQR